jgi:RNA polymerase sigma-70 factor (ECF subfamily)
MDSKTFQAQVLPFKDKLYRYAKSLLGAQQDAEDAIQEVFIKLWNQRFDLDRVNSLEAWAMRITRNWCLDRLKSKKHRVVELPEASRLKNQSQDLERETEWKDAFVLVRKIMTQLPEQQKSVLHLREIEQLSYKEISDITGQSIESVKVNLFRARKRVRSEYQQVAAYGS